MAYRTNAKIEEETRKRTLREHLVLWFYETPIQIPKSYPSLPKPEPDKWVTVEWRGESTLNLSTEGGLLIRKNTRTGQLEDHYRLGDDDWVDSEGDSDWSNSAHWEHCREDFIRMQKFESIKQKTMVKKEENK